MPYPNEHSCRLREPGEFQEGSMRRIRNGILSIIIGKLKGATATTKQAFRYSKADWTEAQARKHCSDNGGKFEAAASEVRELEIDDCFDSGYSPVSRDDEGGKE